MLQAAANTISYHYVENDQKYCPVSTLDHTLCFKDNLVEPRFFSFLDGSEITNETMPAFLERVTKDAQENRYENTDHLFTLIEVGSVSFLYVSLDNSVRANSNGHPLSGRLNNICDAVAMCLEKLERCVVFFSESCREFPNVSWFKIRQTISERCGLKYLGECANNEDACSMAFGISAFCTEACVDLIYAILPRHISTFEFGSGSVGVKLVTGEIVWGIHFPIDFRRTGDENSQFKAMTGLVDVMRKHEGSVAAIGDFNTIPGNPIIGTVGAIPDDMEMLGWDLPTFFGAFYDVIPAGRGDDWVLYQA